MGDGGRLFAAILGPQLVIFTKDLMPPICSPSAISGRGVRGPCRAHHPDVLPRAGRDRGRTQHRRRGRPLGGKIMRQPRLIVAVVCGVASYALMNLMMTAAPLACTTADIR